LTLSIPTPLQELDALKAALEAGEKALAAGEDIDLAGMDAQVARLCDEITRTEGALRLEALPRLEAVIHVLNRLEHDLRQSTRAKEQADARLRAAQAYGGNSPSKEKQ
jgi:hypothetical protein